MPQEHSLNVAEQLPTSVRCLVSHLEQMTSFSPCELSEAILKAGVKEEDLSAFARLAHPKNECYGRVLVYDAGFFKIMIMTWKPGDFSAIHDHGYMKWGAVQVFGAAESAIFFEENGAIRTLVRETVKKFDVVLTHHDTIHQMGNSGVHPLLTLQVYGNQERSHRITDDARIFDFAEGTVKRTDGGAFFAMSEDQINRRENAPKPDYPTWLRHQVELIRRIRKCTDEYPYTGTHNVNKLVQDLFDVNNHQLVRAIREKLGSGRETRHSDRLGILNWEMKQAAQLQSELLSERKNAHNLQAHTSLSDAGHVCLRNYVQEYLKKFFNQYNVKGESASVLSVECGTCLVKEHLINVMGVHRNNLLGVDLFKAVIDVEKHRINLKVEDVLKVIPVPDKSWDIVFCDFTVFQYVANELFEPAVGRMAALVGDGGYLVGDFIQYFLPTLKMVRECFEAYFSSVHLIDALSLKRLGQDQNTTMRYVIIARK